MRIIKRGAIPEEQIFTATCTHCHTEVEFQRSEAVQGSDRNETYLKVTCPVCKREIWKWLS